MAEVDVGRGRVDPELHAQRLAPLEAALELAGREDVDRPEGQTRDLFCLSEAGLPHRGNARLTRRLGAHGSAGGTNGPTCITHGVRAHRASLGPTATLSRRAPRPKVSLLDVLKQRQQRRRSDRAGRLPESSEPDASPKEMAKEEARERARERKRKRDERKAERRAAGKGVRTALQPACDSGDGWQPAAARRRAETAPEEAAHPARLHGPRPAGARLLGLRRDDGRRAGPPGPRGTSSVRPRPELGRLLQRRHRADDPDREREADPARVGRDLSRPQAGGRLDRGRALLRAPRDRLPRHRSRPPAGHRLRGSGAGRLDDHPAVRQERSRGTGQPDRAAEAARGSARLPDRAPVVEGQDPHQLSEQHLLRQRRIRGRGGGQDLLRLEPSRLRQPRRSLRRGGRAAGGGDARGADLLPDRLRPRYESQRCDGATQRRAAEDARPGRSRAQRRGLPGTGGDAGSDQEADQPADRGVRGSLLHRLAAAADRRQVRCRPGVRRWPADQVDARPRPPERGRSDRQGSARGTRARPRPWS